MGKLGPLTRLLQVRTTEEQGETDPLRNHVIIAGYGLTGRTLARSLAKIRTRYVIADLNTENVRDATRRVEPAYFGDVTSPEVLEHLGVADASELIVAINDPDATVRAVRAARRSVAESSDHCTYGLRRRCKAPGGGRRSPRSEVV